jgi:hypothetical protein
MKNKRTLHIHRILSPAGCVFRTSGRAHPLPRLSGDLPILTASIMARPKVLPANRLRANTACTACRSSKKRCSGSFPCTNCINKGRSRTCTPFKSLNTSLRNRPAHASRPEASDRLTWNDAETEAQSSLRSRTHEIITPRRESDTLETGSRSPEATHQTHPRMLRNLQGERGMTLHVLNSRMLIDSRSQCMSERLLLYRSYSYCGIQLLSILGHHSSPTMEEVRT